MSAATITCKTCDKGVLVRKKMYRMSAPVVLIGYIFLIPSLLGIALGVLGMTATTQAAGQTSADIYSGTRTDLMAAKVPEPIIEAVVNGKPSSQIDQTGLPAEQKKAVSDAILARSAQTVGAGIGVAAAGGLSAGLMIVSFVGGLLGWLLVMQKRVLKCNACGASMAAD